MFSLLDPAMVSQWEFVVGFEGILSFSKLCCNRLFRITLVFPYPHFGNRFSETLSSFIGAFQDLPFNFCVLVFPDVTTCS